MQHHPEKKNTWNRIYRGTIDGTFIKNEFSECGSNGTCFIELDTVSTLKRTADIVSVEYSASM